MQIYFFTNAKMDPLAKSHQNQKFLEREKQDKKVPAFAGYALWIDSAQSVKT